MMYRVLKTIFVILFVSITVLAFAQPAPPDSLYGKELRIWLKKHWYDGKHNSLGYNGATGARGRMYNWIDNYNNEVETIYGGYITYIQFGGTVTNPENGRVNCEHIVPQSFFSESGENGREPMRSDIHHLAPSYRNWNSTRSNYPFDNIADTDVTKWMIETREQNTIPAVNPSDYSKFSNSGNYNRFEPRDKVKGDIARAVLYFYTMYEDNEDVNRDIYRVFRNLQVALEWHEMDPPDRTEEDRNRKVEIYQGNRNPYIDFPEALKRAWFMDGPDDDEVISSVYQELTPWFSVFPNPADDFISIATTYFDSFHCMLYDVSGKQISTIVSTTNELKINTDKLGKGIYMLQISTEDTRYTYRFIKK